MMPCLQNSLIWLNLKYVFPKKTFSFDFIQFECYTCHDLLVWDKVWFEHWFGHFATLGLNIMKLMNESVAEIPGYGCEVNPFKILCNLILE